MKQTRYLSILIVLLVIAIPITAQSNGGNAYCAEWRELIQNCTALWCDHE